MTQFFSMYLVAPAVAWLSAQLLKYMLHSFKTKKLSELSPFYMSGNMPSVHTATVTALTLAVAIGEGTDSAIFALTLIFSCIVIYDAMQVRRAVGEQGQAMAKLLNKARLSLKPYQAMGHRPIEVAVGALVGVIAGILALLFL